MSYQSLSAASVRLIAKWGKDVVLISEPSTPADAGKPWLGSARDETQWTKVEGVKGLPAEWTSKELKDSRITQEDVKLLVAGEDPALLEAGLDMVDVTHVELEGVRLGAMVVDDLKPGDTNLLFTLRLRRA